MAEQTCGLCGHVMTLARCGHAWADGVSLCHADDHECYERWTVYGCRPNATVPSDEFWRVANEEMVRWRSLLDLLAKDD